MCSCGGVCAFACVCECSVCAVLRLHVQHSCFFCYRRRRVKSGAVSRRKRLEDCRLLMQFIQDIVDVSVFIYYTFRYAKPMALTSLPYTWIIVCYPLFLRLRHG